MLDNLGIASLFGLVGIEPTCGAVVGEGLALYAMALAVCVLDIDWLIWGVCRSGHSRRSLKRVAAIATDEKWDTDSRCLKTAIL